MVILKRIKRDDYYQVFLLVLQVSYNLKSGQVKSAKAALKQLQQSTQSITELAENGKLIEGLIIMVNYY